MSFESPAGELHPDLASLAQERNGHARVGLEEGHEGDQGNGTSCDDRLRAGVIQLRGGFSETTAPYVHEGGLQERWRGTSKKNM